MRSSIVDLNIGNSPLQEVKQAKLIKNIRIRTNL